MKRLKDEPVLNRDVCRVQKLLGLKNWEVGSPWKSLNETPEQNRAKFDLAYIAVNTYLLQKKFSKVQSKEVTNYSFTSPNGKIFQLNSTSSTDGPNVYQLRGNYEEVRAFILYLYKLKLIGELVTFVNGSLSLSDLVELLEKDPKKIKQFCY